jgi:glycosyltransferase involved in cell wall biosynthesis
MLESPQRVLLVCHASAADKAAEAVRGLVNLDARIDVLCYGRAGEGRPAPPGTRLIEIGAQQRTAIGSTLRILGGLLSQRYDIVALSQPMLGLSRARGLLVAFSYLVGRRRAMILDPSSGVLVGPIPATLAAAEASRWLGFQALSAVFARLASAVLQRLGDHAVAPLRPIRVSGSVLYLRTDVDLRVTPLRAGGSLAHTDGIIAALLERGHEVSFWSTGEVDGIPDSVAQSRLPAIVMGNLPTEIAELLSGVVQGLHRPRAPRPSGFIYQRYSLNNLAGVILAARWRVPLVLEANGSEAKWRQDFSSLRFPRLAYACERVIVRRAQVVAAVSANAGEDLVAAGAPAERLRVVPNGVRLARFAEAKPMDLPSLNGRFVVCFVGLFYPWHGVRYLAEAFALFHRRTPTARLLLVGDGEEAPVVRSVLERHDVLRATYLPGLVPRAEAPRYMAAADVLVSPHANVRHFIGSPIKLFEYMAAGKPIVATRVGQIAEVLRDGDTALLVAPQDPEAMAAALERLYGDRELGARLGRAAQAEARAQHSWDARLAAILDDADHSEGEPRR